VSQALARWWRGGVSPRVKFVYLVLLANGVPAFFLLTLFPGDTDDLFVWTIVPEASAQLLGVMYGNALLLVVIGLAQPSWERARVTVVVIAFFSVAATIVTLFNLDPFLKHPWYHLAYWLSMYVILFFAAPLVFLAEEREHGGRLPRRRPAGAAARAVAGVSAVAFGAVGVALLGSPSFMSDRWPWELTPLVARILGVWLCALALAFAWALWDGDAERVRPLFWQGAFTGPALALVPLLHADDVSDGAGGELALYLGLAALFAAAGAVALGSSRAR
jgi:hypothetical protein